LWIVIRNRWFAVPKNHFLEECFSSRRGTGRLNDTSWRNDSTAVDSTTHRQAFDALFLLRGKGRGDRPINEFGGNYAAQEVFTTLFATRV
jgi:hypothetical protein